MEGGGRGKLSLRRKRPADGPPASRPSRPQKAGLSQAQGHARKTSIRAARPHPNRPGPEDVASLPAFLPKGKSSQTDNPAAKPETFHAGMQTFPWVPFPLYQREGTKGSKSRRSQNSGHEMDGRRGKEEDESPKVVPPVTAEVSEMTSPPPESPGSSSFRHRREFEELRERGSVQEEIMENRRGSGKENPPNNGSCTRHGTGSVLAAGEPHSVSDSGQEKTEDPSKEMQLEKCPLCQMPFIGNWSQLEVDSHLAQCLSESTDDAW